MALNRRKTVIFVGKKGTVKNAVKSACNAIMADWQANGRPASGTAPASGLMTPDQQKIDSWWDTNHAKADSPPKSPTVVLLVQTTAAAQKRCKPQTIADVMNDTVAYLNAKGVAVGTTDTSAYSLTLIIDRPASKWIEITAQARNQAGGVLWSDTVSDGGWIHGGGEASLKALEKLHQVIDSRLGAQNGLPLAAAKN